MVIFINPLHENLVTIQFTWPSFSFIIKTYVKLFWNIYDMCGPYIIDQIT